jgi:hypothetical protein
MPTACRRALSRGAYRPRNASQRGTWIDRAHGRARRLLRIFWSRVRDQTKIVWFLRGSRELSRKRQPSKAGSKSLISGQKLEQERKPGSNTL